MQKMQYKFALENEILDDPKTANAYNEYAPITNAVLGVGNLKQYGELRPRYPKVITDTNDF
jgi:hypothetical protein